MPPFTAASDKDDSVSMHKLLLSSDFGIWLWEPNTDALFFNDVYMRMLGYSHTRFPFHISTWTKLIHPDEREAIMESQRRVLNDPAHGDSFENRFRMLTVSGEYIWILGRGFVVCRDEHGAALRVSGLHIDMRSLDQALEEMAIQHDRMWFALEAARDGLWDWNPATGDVYFSPRYIAMLGYKPNEFPPDVESWVGHVHPQDLANTVQMQYDHIEHPEMGDLFECMYRFLAADGTYKWILGRGKVTRRDASGRGTRVVGLHTDITELRNTQESLTQLLHQDSLTRLCSRFFFDQCMQNLQPEDYPVSVLFCDVDGLKMVNDNGGHAMGDELLITAAASLRRCMPCGSVTARLGGDEFAILLRNTSDTEAKHILDCIQQECEKHNQQAGVLPIFLATGLVSTETMIPVHRLLAFADIDMRANKAITHTKNLQILKTWLEAHTGQTINLQDSRLHGTSAETITDSSLREFC